MDGRAFLQSARDLLAVPSEANWRSAAGRSYYALLHEGRVILDRWGFSLPPRESLHSFVRLRFDYAAHPELKQVGDAVGQLGRLRNQADYRLDVPGPFGSATVSAQSVDLAQDAIDLLDAIDADPVRRATAVAATRAAWP
jgi:hypothetical protein